MVKITAYNINNEGDSFEVDINEETGNIRVFETTDNKNEKVTNPNVIGRVFYYGTKGGWRNG